MSNSSRAAVAEDVDILQHIAVTVPCATCGEHYEVTLRQVLVSHQLLHHGCQTDDDTECPPLTYAALGNESAIRDLARSWDRVVQDVRATGFELSICRPVLSH